MVLDLLQQTVFAQVRDDALTGREAIQPPVGLGGLLVQAGIGVEDIDQVLAERAAQEGE